MKEEALYSLENRTVLVTGATGLIGSNIVDTLMEFGNIRVIALGRSASKLKSIFHKYLENEKFLYIVKDISEPLNYLQEEIDVIFHAAGPIAGNIISNSPLDVIWPNILGTQNCLEFIRKQEEEKDIKGKVIIFSSATIYGDRESSKSSVTENETAVTGAIHEVAAPYFESKRMVEVLARAYHKQYEMDVVIARFSYVYGFTKVQPNTAFYQFIDSAVRGEDIVIKNSTLDMRDNIYIDDAVRGVINLCYFGKAGEAYNISSNGELNNYASVDQMAEQIAAIINSTYNFHRKISVRLPEEIVRRPGIRLNNEKMKMLGWNISTSMEKGIALILKKKLMETNEIAEGGTGHVSRKYKES